MKIKNMVDSLAEINECNPNNLTYTQEAAILHIEQKLSEMLSLLKYVEDNDARLRNIEIVNGALSVCSRLNVPPELKPVSGLTIHRDRVRNSKIIHMVVNLLEVSPDER